MPSPPPADERIQEFEDFFRLLSAENADPAGLSAAFVSLYKDGWRHSYSEITRLLTDRSQNEEQYEELFGTCMQNLQTLEEHLRQADADNADAQLRQHHALIIFKLRDHLNLENYRLKHIKESLGASVQKIQQLQELQQSLERQVAEYDRKFAEYHRDMTRQKRRVRRLSHKFITTLSIFATILVSAFTLLTFGKEVMGRTADTSFPVLAFIFVLVGYLLLQMLDMMYRFISRISRIREVGIEDRVKGIFLSLIAVLGWWAYHATALPEPPTVTGSQIPGAAMAGASLQQTKPQ